ncbi:MULTISPECIES: hypothetical protein [unclassified Dehalobacter]|uniref:hypothetical protein n=1 Tax=unclassified Dehalobacter TaxID=2635733 RepID=UPI000E6C32B9|nr:MULTISPECIES: hypothetical protein [unclassified Dehalobacter]RJE48910.1 hypothetical protein A7K50_09210 [Dehalobacter sp. MCB1]TCX52074.1 hypothetical protein C1I36_07095 [Dehalobacter sp. 14DCB1]TCX53147.1 hypothetical protein C1I38_08860 [Dehalobacter sp. 12DCB1]
MGHFDERFNNHQVMKSLQEISSLIEEARKLHISNPFHEETFQRVEGVYQQLGRIFDNVDTSIFSFNVLQNLQNPMIQINSIIRNYINDSNQSNRENAIAQINSHLEGVIQQLGTIYYPRTPEDFEGFKDIIVSLRRSVSQHKSNTEKDYEDLLKTKLDIENKLNDLAKNITTEKNRIDNIINDAQNSIANFKNQFTDSQEKRSENYTKELEVLQQKNKERIDEWNATFNDLLNTTKDNIENFNNNLSTYMENFKNELLANAQKYEKELEEQRSYIKNLVGTLTNNGLSYGYRKYANQSMWTKIIWQIVAVASMIGMIIFAIKAAEHALYNKENFNWVVTGTKWFVAAAFASIATYSGKQAGSNHKSEKYYRKLELELASLDPYLLTLEKEQQQEIKQELAKKIFGNNDFFVEEGKNSIDNDKNHNNSVTDVVVALKDIITKNNQTSI